MRRATSLPLLLGGAGPELSDRNYLAATGVRIALQGHMPFYAAAKATYDMLKYLREGGDPAGLKTQTASDGLLDIALRLKDYDQWQKDYLQ